MGAGDERVTNKSGVEPRANVMAFEPKLKAAFTCTVALESARPYDEAVMVADPKLTPDTCGTAVGVVAPSRKMMLAGFTDTMEGLLLSNET